MTEIEVDGERVRLEDDGWVSSSCHLAAAANGLTDYNVVSGADADPDRVIAEDVARKLGGRVVSPPRARDFAAEDGPGMIY